MSTVYRGTDLRLDRPVAIKVMRPEYSTDPTFLTRFEREARSAAGLRHPGVVAVYDQGRDGDTVFLVMELVDGGTLRDLIRQQGALSVPVALSILEPVLSALGAAHEAGLVHRDIKPENVLISSKGEVKVADFGLVRAVTSTTMATGDVILGTVAYLSPEQVSTGDSDARSDVYAAGIVAFEMLTGTPPYTGGNPISVAYQHVNSDVPAVSTRAPGVPEALDAILLKATARNTADRPADAAALLSELIRMRARLLIRRVPVPVPTPVPPPRAFGPGPGGTQAIVPTPPSATAPETDPNPVPPQTGRTERVAAPLGPPPPSPTEVRRRRRKRLTWIWVLVVILLVAAAAGTGWWLASGRYTNVPQVIGLSRESAVATLESANLVAVTSTRHDDTVPAGRVAQIDPLTGAKLLRGAQVTVFVSSGRPVVPRIEPDTEVAAAMTALTAADLTGTVDQEKAVYSATIPAGRIVDTDPKAGAELPIGSSVTLIVSKGKQPVTIPPLADKTVADAENALKAVGLTPGQHLTQFDPTRKAGMVISASPAEGQTVDAGSAVQLLVSNSLEVPDVRGRPQADADATLKAAGLTMAVGPPVFDANVDGGQVVKTDPAAGFLVDPANPGMLTVTVTLSNAVTMPNVVGGNLENAGGQLRAMGLLVQVQTQLFSSSTIRSQQPRAGTRLAPGSTVVLSTIN
jgi:eukaryotic-like serine/threonine-protein kinase